MLLLCGCLVCCFRFNGRIYSPLICYKFMELVNIRFFYGGKFVSSKKKNVYQGDGIYLKLNVEEVAFFEFVRWVRDDLNFGEAGEFWYRKRGFSLHNGRARILGDADIPNFLASPENDGFYHLYSIMPEKEKLVGNPLAYGLGVTFCTDSDAQVVDLVMRC